MTTIYISRTIKHATSLEQVVESISAGGVREGMEGIEFTPDQLAGQYAEDAAHDSGFPVDAESIKAHLAFLTAAGASFDRAAALAHGLAINAARD